MRITHLVWFALFAAPVHAAAPKPFAVREYLDANCTICHNAANRKGGLDLVALPATFGDSAVAAKWVRVHDRVRAGEMPPASRKDRPAESDTAAMLSHVSSSLIDAETVRRKGEGRAAVRRLNREEFENTLRDLLDLPGLDVREMLPEDGRDGGFNKSARALDVGPILLAKYLEAIDRALDLAIAKTSVPPEVERRTLHASSQYDFKVLMTGGDAVLLKDMKFDPRFPLPSGRGKYGEPQFFFGGKYKDLGAAERAGVFREPSSVGMFRTIDESFGGRFHFTPLHPGRYEIGVTTWAYWWDKGEVKSAPRDGALGLYCGDRLLGHFTAPSLKPTGHSVSVWLDTRPRNYLKVSPASLWPTHLYFRQGQAGGYSGPGVAIDSLTVAGPIYDEWPPESHRRLFGSLPVVALHKLPADAPRPKRARPEQLAYDAVNGVGRLVFGTVTSDDPERDARKLLAAFLPRAFRRPVGDAVIDGYVRIVRDRISKQACFEDAMRTAYRTALSSPDFLFLRASPGELDDFALASRLSFYLWNSTPDDTLLSLARAGKLRDKEVMRSQMDRMLGDAKSDRFVADFLDQWLDLRDLDATTPDRTLYPEWTPYLHDAVRREPREFFRMLLREDRHASELVRSDRLVVNQRLAEHYGLAGLTRGTEFRAVANPKDSHRGGLLTSAAVLKVTANGTTTSPVKRGTWVLRKLLGTPPQPPPPEIPAIEPDVRGTTTVRQLLAKHRADPSCAACHRHIDPPGFALESFDPIGGYRVRYRATEGKDAPDFDRAFLSHLDPAGKFPTRDHHIAFRVGPAVDASGETADGKTFDGVEAFRALFLADGKAVPRNLAAQLVAYATGAGVGFADRAEVDAIAERAGGRVRATVREVVMSELFRRK